jgi:hypothetical protein
MYSKFQLARLLIYYAAYCADLGRDVPIEAALSKLYGSEVALEIASEAIQCMGGNGAMQIYPVERYMRDAKLGQIAAGTSEVLRLLIYRMGSRYFAGDLKAPVRMMDEELNIPLPVGRLPKPKVVKNEMDVLRVLAENYRTNPGLHMTIADMKQFLEVSNEVLLQYLADLEKKGMVSQFKNRKGEVELVKATFTGLREANPPDYYKHIPSWVLPQDIF